MTNKAVDCMSHKIAKAFATILNSRQESFSLPKRRSKAVTQFLQDLALAEKKGRESNLQFD